MLKIFMFLEQGSEKLMGFVIFNPRFPNNTIEKSVIIM